MKTPLHFGIALRTLSFASLFAATSAWSAVVWTFNPTSANAPVGSTSRTYTSSGFQIIARAYDNPTNTPHALYFKNEAPYNGAIETGLGLVNTASNEFNSGPLNYLQLDLRSILGLGFTNGQIKVGSLQNGEGFQLFGSNVQGTLGTAIGGAFTGLAFDNQFVSIPSFGAFQFISIAAATGNVLPIAFAADLTPIPEMSTLLPIVGLVGAASMLHLMRRRRSASAA